MSAPAPYREIEGLAGVEPVGAVLTVGVKSAEKGNPTQTDRFFVVQPNEEKGVRPKHPAFRAFNDAPVEVRQSIEANFVHATIGDAWLYYLRAQRLPAPNPNAPAMKPSCSGDGRTATRFAGVRDGEEVWSEIACPHRLCAFRQGAAPACRPFGRLYFRPHWPAGKLPAPLMKWTTTAWRSIGNVVGFFDHLSTQAEQLGLIPRRAEGLAFNPACPIYGVPFSLTLGRKTQPQHGRSFPVVTISPTIDLVAFFLAQKQRLDEIGGRLIAVGNTNPGELEPRALAADFRAITPGIPGREESEA